MKTIKKKVWVVVTKRERLVGVYKDKSDARNNAIVCLGDKVLPATLTYKLPKKKNKKSTK